MIKGHIDIFKFNLAVGSNTTRWSILSELYDKPMNAKELTKKLSSDKIVSKTSYSNIHRHLSALKKRGLIKFESNKKERGKPNVAHLTDESRNMLKDAKIKVEVP